MFGEVDTTELKVRKEIWQPIVAAIVVGLLAAILVVAVIGVGSWNAQRDVWQAQQEAREDLATELLLKLNTYDAAVYDDPNVSSIAQQQFRATEFLLEVLKTLAAQNAE